MTDPDGGLGAGARASRDRSGTRVQSYLAKRASAVVAAVALPSITYLIAGALKIDFSALEWGIIIALLTLLSFTWNGGDFATSRFVDVDRVARPGSLSERLAKLEGIMDGLAPIPRPDRLPPPPPPPPDFTGYFSDLVAVLQAKSAAADEKASILLDKGVAYSRLGIIFYVASIIGWQALAWERGWRPEFIYGLASCSILFIFIEFLAAWFLKQYRAFVDTSTYLIKVKSLFDRYMLTYLAQGDARIMAAPESPAAAALFAMLAGELKWPESYLARDADVSIAREFMTSLSELVAAGRKPKEA